MEYVIIGCIGALLVALLLMGGGAKLNARAGGPREHLDGERHWTNE